MTSPKITPLANTNARVVVGLVNGGRPSGPSYRLCPPREPSIDSQPLSVLAMRPAADCDAKAAGEGVGHIGVSRGAQRELQPNVRRLESETGSRGWKK